MSTTGFLNNCFDLFSRTLSAVLGQPLLSFFAGTGLVLALVALVVYLIHSARRF